MIDWDLVFFRECFGKVRVSDRVVIALGAAVKAIRDEVDRLMKTE